MRQTIRKLGTFGDVAASGILVGVATLVNFASTLVLARSLGPTAFGLLSTCRRVVAFVAPFANLGGHLGVSRYLGYYTCESRPRSAVLALGLLLCVVSLPITLGIFVPLQKWAGEIGWTQSLARSVWSATWALTSTTAAGLVVFSVLRGFGHPGVANLHQVAVLTSYLVLGIFFWGTAVARLLALFATAAAAINVLFLVWVVRAHRAELRRPHRAEWRVTSRETARFSLSRLADGPLQASLSLICVLLAPSVGGLALSGYIHISQTLVRMSEILIVPLSVIFLPLVARWVREGQTERLRHQAQLVYDSVVLAGCCVTTQGLVWAGALLGSSFGNTYGPAEPYVLTTLPAILPFLLFAGFRSFIDGYSVRPVNCWNLLAAGLVVLVLGVFLGGALGGLGLSLSYTVGMTVLGSLSLAYAVRHFSIRVATRHTSSALLLAAGGALLSYPVVRWVEGREAWVTFCVCGLALGAVTAISATVALRLGHPTVRYAIARLREARDKSAPPRETSAAHCQPDDRGDAVCRDTDAVAATISAVTSAR